MKTKIFTLLSLSVLALVMLMSFASADVIYSPTELIGSGNSGETVEIIFTITNNDESDLHDVCAEFSDLVLDTSLTIALINLNIPELVELNILNGESEKVTLTISIPTDQVAGIYAGIVELFGTFGEEEPQSIGTLNISLTVEPNYCELGNQGDWISIKRVKDKKIDNDDEWKWRPLDEIEITVEVENVGYDDKIRGTIEYGLYDEDDDDFIFEEEMDFSLKEDEKEKFTIEFKIDPTDLNDDTGDNDYIFYVKVYDDDDASEDTQCKQFIQDVEIRKEKDEVTLEPWEIEILPKEVGCSSQVELMIELFNIGTDNQEDVSVRLYNKELGINIMQEVGDIDAIESKDVKFAFTIPEDAEEKLYDLEIIIFDEDDDIYEIENHEGDEHDAKFYYSLKVEGNCITEPKATVSANLESDAKAGGELIIKATITNTGVETSTFEISVSDYAEWASLGSIDVSSIVLGAGESGDVLITLDVNSDVSGNKNFNIIVAEGTKVKSYQVPIMIEKKGWGFTGDVISGDNWPIWTIGAINIILIFIIILVALKVAKK